MMEEEILEIIPRLRISSNTRLNGKGFSKPTRNLLRKLREGNEEPNAIVNGHLTNLTRQEKEIILTELKQEHASRMEKRRTALETVKRSGVLEDLRNFAARLRNLTRD